MIAKEVEIDTWFYSLSKKMWYKKIYQGKTNIKGTQIGSPKEYLIDNNEEVEIKTK